MIRKAVSFFVLAGLSVGKASAQDVGFKPSELVASCGGYVILVEPDSESEITTVDFSTSTLIIANRIKRFLGHGSVINIRSDQRVEFAIPKVFERDTFDYQMLVNLMEANGNFGIYAVVDRGDEGKYPDDETVHAFQQKGASDVYWYTMQDPLLRNADVNEVTRNAEPHEFFGEVITLSIGLGNNENAAGFAEYVSDAFGSPLIAVIDDRAWTDFVLTAFDRREPFSLAVSTIPLDTRFFDAVIHEDPLPYQVVVSFKEERQPLEGASVCPITN